MINTKPYDNIQPETIVNNNQKYTVRVMLAIQTVSIDHILYTINFRQTAYKFG